MARLRACAHPALMRWRRRQNSRIVAWHLHRGGPEVNGEALLCSYCSNHLLYSRCPTGPIILGACGEAAFAVEQVIDRPAGAPERVGGNEFVRNVPRCAQSNTASYSLLPLAKKTLPDEEVLSLSQAFSSIQANPSGFYVNVRAFACCSLCACVRSRGVVLCCDITTQQHCAPGAY